MTYESRGLTLVSHDLCPYVQRAAISMTEKGVPFERIYIDLANKPDWFKRISPLGKVPLLLVGDKIIFESNVILEYLEDQFGHPLHPSDALERADHRAWIEFGSAVINAIGAFYSAPTKTAFNAKREVLEEKFAWVEARLRDAEYFGGSRFSLVDAVFGPIFRYFDVFDSIGDFGIFDGKPKALGWRENLARRESVRNAVVADYPDRLLAFLQKRDAHLSSLIT